ncbi:PUA-like domain-containing protein [Mycena rosella]|uniref:PUA-like domain-containing protein n=1 Tax=Mycena rosella TaxID=1033263 RepID=A0AAD7D7T9_MYCRO|nr:PUA-like domain-containing protein [Mycena rosella]
MASESLAEAADTAGSPNYWLLKAEPDSRMVKGKDVKFSVDDFEAAKTSPWEGVRNYEARNLMKEMKRGEKALFYHSNCKAPGIAAFAEVAKEAYPDHTAWDSAHPYYDPKTKQADPKWFMVDLAFGARAKHFVPLALLRFIADAPAAAPPAGLEYLGADGVAAIKAGMDLVTRGRLSVQRVSAAAWGAVQLLADTGGWDALELAPKKKAAPKKAAAGAGAGRPARAAAAAKTKAKARKKKRGSDSEDEGDDDYDEEEEEEVISKTTSSRRKRKAEEYEELPTPTRRARAKT